jgi:hypothetical protein
MTRAADTPAAAKARTIYQALLEQGWEFVCRQFSRELAVGFAGCANPVLWTSGVRPS